MSPTWRTRSTLGSPLIEVMNAGVWSVSVLSVGLVPYGESPYTAIVNTLLERGTNGVPCCARTGLPTRRAAPRAVHASRKFCLLGVMRHNRRTLRRFCNIEYIDL